MSKHKYSKEFLERTGAQVPEHKREHNNDNEESTEPLKPFPQTALGMYAVREGAGTKYVLVRIGYNPESGDVGFVEEVSRDIREDTIDRFKVEVDNQGFFTGEKRQ